MTLEQAQAKIGKGADGVGFVFRKENGIVGVDLDHCVHDGQIDSWARQILARLCSYAEYSMSGTGVHCLVRGSKPEWSLARRDAVECYDDGRQFVLTGNVVDGMEQLAGNQPGIDWLCNTYLLNGKPSGHPLDTPPPKVDQSNLVKRAREYIARRDYSISGQNGHGALWSVALDLIRGFGLSLDDAYPLICEYNQNQCDPAWSDQELIHKLQDASTRSRLPMGYLAAQVPPSASEGQPEAPKRSRIITADQCVTDYLDGLASGSYRRIPTGISELDFALGGGVRAGELIVVQGRPSHGKTALALHLQDVFAGCGYNVLLISKEMNSAAIGQRLMQRLNGAEPEEDQIEQAKGVWKDSRSSCMGGIMVADRVGDIHSLLDTVAEGQAKYGSQVVIVDYLQLLTGKGSSQYERMTNVSMHLAALKQAGLTMVVLSQMNRGIEHRDSFAPKGSDARDTGQIEQDCDIHLSVVWDIRAMDKNGMPQYPDASPQDFTIYVHKNRQGRIVKDRVRCRFDAESQRFDPPEEIEEHGDDRPTQSQAEFGYTDEDEEVRPVPVQDRNRSGQVYPGIGLP